MLLSAGTLPREFLVLVLVSVLFPLHLFLEPPLQKIELEGLKPNETKKQETKIQKSKNNRS